MNEIVTLSKPPQADVTVRDATIADVEFIDGLQKLHNKQLGFMRTSWIEGKIARDEIIIAIDASGPVGYCMGVDRYFKRDDVGIVHQMSIVPGRQRGFIGATLLKAMFERAAYGCRLFCCWCAQDLEANRFWESMGFVPLAYRAGSEKKSRVHIFWQKRIREGDRETPWWFPSKTDSGAMRADRIVLPIPPELHWSDEMPVMELVSRDPGVQPVLEDSAAREMSASRNSNSAKRGLKTRVTGHFDPPPSDGSKRHGARQFDKPSAKPAAPIVAPVPEKPKRVKKPKAKAHPTVIKKARELRDRWLERVNSGAAMIESSGKYDVTRQWHLSGVAARSVPLLPDETGNPVRAA